MIELTRLNGSSIVVNSDLIKTAEAAPDTMLTLISGEKLIVREECGEVIERVIAYRARLLAEVLQQLPAGVDAARFISMTSLRMPHNSEAILPPSKERPLGDIHG